MTALSAASPRQSRRHEPALPTPTVVVVERGEENPASEILKRAGFEVCRRDSPEAARAEVFGKGRIDLVVIDLRSVECTGRELCAEVRAAGGPPVIAIGARGDEAELVEIFQLGAEDYLVPPVAGGELVARARAALARRQRAPAERPRPQSIGPLRIEPANRSVKLDGEPIHLTPREYALLLALAENAGTVVSREELFTRVWGPGWIGTTKALDVQISGLRRKLGESSGRPRLIHTVRGVGFLLAPAD